MFLQDHGNRPISLFRKEKHQSAGGDKVSKLILNPEYQLYEQNGRVFCSSRQVAEEFEKQHDNVLRDIRNLDCSTELLPSILRAVNTKIQAANIIRNI
jgi:hypothetical protein